MGATGSDLITTQGTMKTGDKARGYNELMDEYSLH
jgi:hypothetical protein